MSRFLVVAFALLVFAAPAQAQFKSPNVSLQGKLPQSAGAIGARFSEDGSKMYVSSATGLQIYDVSAPATPKQLSQLAGENNSDNGHIANCIAGCDYQYTTGTAEGLTVYDIRDLDAPTYVKTIALPGDGFTHDVHVDATGIAWVTGEDGTFGFDVTDPLNPVLKCRSDLSITNTGGGLPTDDGSGPLDFLHHNMLRTSIDMNDAGEISAAAETGTGNVLAITEEDYLKPTCEGQGSIQTWRITNQTNPDGSTKLELLDIWTTELNELSTRRAGRRRPATAPRTGSTSATG